MCVVGAAALVGALSVWNPEPWRLADERLGQFAWRLIESDAFEERIVAVEIDEASLRAAGPWPWPRETVARLLDALRTAGAGPVMVDMIFAEPREGDARLVQVLAGGGIVLAEVFALDDQAPGRVGRLAGGTGQRCEGPAPRARGFIGNARVLIEDGRAPAGHISPVVDGDGTVRRVPALVCFDGELHAMLALAGIAQAAGVDGGWRLARSRDRFGPAWRVEHPELPGIVAPMDADGSTRVPFRIARSAFRSVSAARVLGLGATPLEEGSLHGALVLVGGSAFGLGDAVPTPQSGLALGMEVHLQLAAALLDGNLPYRPLAARWMLAAEASVAAAILLMFALGRRRRAARWVLLAGVGLAGLTWVAHLVWLQAHDWWLGWIALPAFCLALAASLAIWGQARTLTERDRLARQFAAYLPGSVVSRLAEVEPSTRIEAERRAISVLFADIRNFSGFAEGRSPEDVATFLQGFFDAAARIVDRHGGTVDKFMGDEVMALFGIEGPAQQAQRHAAAALAAAEELVAFSRHYLGTWADRTGSDLGLGVGIESGPALVGNFGGMKRRTYTALGHTVTIASRLEPLTRRLGRAILVGPGTAAALGPRAAARLDDLGEFQLPGMSAAQRVFSPRVDNAASGSRARA